MIPPRSLRFRMMVLFCCVVGVFLAGTYLVIYALFAEEAASQLDRQLVEAAKPVIADLVADPGEQAVTTLDLPNQYLELLDASGHLLQHSRNLEGHRLDSRDLSLGGSGTTFRTLNGGEKGTLRMALIPFRQGNDSLVLAIAVPIRDTDQALARFRRMLLVLLPLSLVIMAVISAWYVGRSLRPIVDLTQHAARMAQRLAHPLQRDLQAPLPVVNPHDELGRLAQTFNQLFARINAVVRQLRQFVSDASHELRTPLSVLRGETELLLSQPRPPEEYQKTLRVMDGELKKLDRIVEGLFTLSMADAGQLRLSRDPLYLDEVLDEACELAVPLARPKGIVIEREIEREVACQGDEAFLRQLFLVFLDNAIKYSPPNTRVRVNLTKANGFARTSFRDQGVGISSEHLPHIFERFYRAAVPGNGEARSGGLGLAIAQAIAQAQGGSIQCETTPGTGSTFIVDLPLHSPHEPA